MKKSVFIITFILLKVLGVYSQTINGNILGQDGKGLGMVNVAALNYDFRFITGMSTHENGSFSFVLPDSIKSCFLTVSYVGMKTDTVEVKSLPQNNLVIRMSSDARMLEGVTVVGSRQIFKNQGNIIVADVQNSILSKSGTINNLMNQIPFVSGSDGEFYVFGRGKALLYLNDRKLYNANELNSLSSERVKKVEVITNPGAKYASDVNAVIKIYTKDNPNGLGGNAMLYLRQGRKFLDVENVSLTYNHNKLQVAGGLSFNDIRALQKASDYSEILRSQSVTTDDVEMNYKGVTPNANVEFDYKVNDKSSIGANTQINWNKITHDIRINSLVHSVAGMEDFSTSADNTSCMKPLKWLTSVYYLVNLRKTHLEVTNDLLLGNQSHLFDYVEKNNSQVCTNGMNHNFMNSFIADASTLLGKTISMSYGIELTYSQEKQKFSFTEQNIETSLNASNNERRQLLKAEYVSFSYGVGRWNFTAGLRYEHTKLNYYENGVKSDMQSSTYDDILPTVDVTFRNSKGFNASVGFRKSIVRPNYALLNDNLQYHSRYEYVQGNSKLKPTYTNSLYILASYKNLRVIGSYDFIDGKIMANRGIYGNEQDVILTQTINLQKFRRMNFGVNWWQQFGFYTPYIEFGFGKQDFKYEFMGASTKYDRPFYNFKVHHTFRLPNNFQAMLFVNYEGKNYEAFRMHTEQWSTQLSLGKSFKGGWFMQLSAYNLFCSNRNASITYCGWVRQATYNDNDRRNIGLLLSYNFNYKNKRHNTRVKTSELNRF